MDASACIRRSYVESLCEGRSLLVGTGCNCIPALLKAYNIDVVVALFEHDECPDEVIAALDNARRQDVAVYHLPVRDYSIEPVYNVVEAARMAAQAIAAGKAVLVSCYGGCGRTGTVISLLNIVYRCMEYGQVVNYYAARRGCGPESSEQYALLYQASRITENCGCRNVLRNGNSSYDPLCVLKGLLGYAAGVSGY